MFRCTRCDRFIDSDEHGCWEDPKDNRYGLMCEDCSVDAQEQFQRRYEYCRESNPARLSIILEAICIRAKNELPQEFYEELLIELGVNENGKN